MQIARRMETHTKKKIGLALIRTAQNYIYEDRERKRKEAASIFQLVEIEIENSCTETNLFEYMRSVLRSFHRETVSLVAQGWIRFFPSTVNSSNERLPFNFSIDNRFRAPNYGYMWSTHLSEFLRNLFRKGPWIILTKLWFMVNWSLRWSKMKFDVLGINFC